MFTRQAINDLERWRVTPYRQPLVVRGARQVGKTTLVNEFGKRFDGYIYLNLEEDSRAREILEMDVELDIKIGMLYAIKGVPRNNQETLFFIDEIQNSPKTITLLRYFYEHYPQLHVIAAGSLLENVVDMSVSFPVGRVQYMSVRPCSFKEFLGALGRSSEYEMITQRPELSLPLHQSFMALFNQYVVVGGMPRAVARYVDLRDVLALDDVYSTLLTAYRDDVEKYVSKSKLKTVVRHILQYGWGLAGDTITLGRFAGSQYNAREVQEAFSLLRKAMLAELAYPTTSTRLPALPQMRRMPKLLWLDTGLVNFAAAIRREVITARDVMDVWRGRIAEHVVAQELLALTPDVNASRLFWVKGNGGANSAEVDFVLQMDGDLVPIEVKSGHNSHLRSLHSFVDASDVAVAVRVWSQPFSVDDVFTTIHHKPFRLLNVPFYLLGELPSIIQAHL